MKTHSHADQNLMQQLWSGDVHLNDVFWNYAIVYGLIINLATTALLFISLLYKWHTAFIVVIFLMPIPYNIFITIAVWRSAEKFDGPGSWPDYAKVAVVIWFIFWTLI
ncbi:MAG: hypothetical protein ACR2PH_05375 [Desulfobulbia bacterium]